MSSLPELLDAAVVGYWIAAIGAVALRQGSFVFRNATAYGRLKASPLVERKGLWSVVDIGRVSKHAAFEWFYLVGLLSTLAVSITAPPVDPVRLVLMTFHLLRRLIETHFFLHSSGYLSWFAAVSGMSFYLTAPWSFMRNVVRTDYHDLFMIAALLCQLVQLWTHFLLGRLKQKSGSGYSPVPFDLLYAPHYTAEVLFYFFCALSAKGTLPIWLMTFFVFVNLCTTARESHAWYVATFPREAGRHRWLVVPFVW